MNRQELVQEIQNKKSCLCVGLDTDITKIPQHLLASEDPIFEFNKAIIDATKEFTVSYKINTAFYEAMGIEGWISMQKTLDYIPENIFTIADAKRGDIGNTSTQYAKAFFEKMNFDSITVAPYMGHDSVQPFLAFKDKWTIILGLTSNPGSADFQMLDVAGQSLFEKVLETTKSYGDINNTMYVVGATQTNYLQKVRAIIPDHFLLIPGVGAQGGDLKEVMETAQNEDVGILINVSRAVIYASQGEDFAEKAGEAAKAYQEAMQELLK